MESKRVRPVIGGKNKKRRVFTDEEVWALRREAKKGASLYSLERKYNASRPTVRDAVRGLGAYKDV